MDAGREPVQPWRVWLDQEARVCEGDGEWAGAAFSLEQLIRQEPKHADHRSREFLGQEVQLIRRLRATKHTKSLRPVLLHRAAKSFRGAVERLVPTRGTELPVFAHQRNCQPIFYLLRHLPPSV